MDTILQTCFLTADLPEKTFCLWISVHYFTVYVCNKMQVSSLNGTWSSNKRLSFSNYAFYTVSQKKTSPTFLAITRESIDGFL